MVSIANIRDADGTLVSDPVTINTQFVEFYQKLYSSRAQYSEGDLYTYFDGIEFLLKSCNIS